MYAHFNISWRIKTSKTAVWLRDSDATAWACRHRGCRGARPATLSASHPSLCIRDSLDLVQTEDLSETRERFFFFFFFLCTSFWSRVKLRFITAMHISHRPFLCGWSNLCWMKTHVPPSCRNETAASKTYLWRHESVLQVIYPFCRKKVEFRMRWRCNKNVLLIPFHDLGKSFRNSSTVAPLTNNY